MDHKEWQSRVSCGNTVNSKGFAKQNAANHDQKLISLNPYPADPVHQ